MLICSARLYRFSRKPEKVIGITGITAERSGGRIPSLPLGKKAGAVAPAFGNRFGSAYGSVELIAQFTIASFWAPVMIPAFL